MNDHSPVIPALPFRNLLQDADAFVPRFPLHRSTDQCPRSTMPSSYHEINLPDPNLNSTSQVHLHTLATKVPADNADPSPEQIPLRITDVSAASLSISSYRNETERSIILEASAAEQVPVNADVQDKIPQSRIVFRDLSFAIKLRKAEGGEERRLVDGVSVAVRQGEVSGLPNRTSC